MPPSNNFMPRTQDVAGSRGIFQTRKDYFRDEVYSILSMNDSKANRLLTILQEGTQVLKEVEAAPLHISRFFRTL